MYRNKVIREILIIQYMWNNTEYNKISEKIKYLNGNRKKIKFFLFLLHFD